jgi:hypothetical protein
MYGYFFPVRASGAALDRNPAAIHLRESAGSDLVSSTDLQLLIEISSVAGELRSEFLLTSGAILRQSVHSEFLLQKLGAVFGDRREKRLVAGVVPLELLGLAGGIEECLRIGLWNSFI